MAIATANENEARQFLQALLSKRTPEEDKRRKFLEALASDTVGSSRFKMFGAKRADNGRDLEISGVAAGYGNIDHQGEVIEYGAFAGSLAHHKRENTKPLMLLNHDRSAGPIGRWDSFYEDTSGLLAKGTVLGGIQRGADVIAMIEGDAIWSLSVGIRGSVKQSIGKVTHIKSTDLAEVSIVDLPANPRARLHRQ